MNRSIFGACVAIVLGCAGCLPPPSGGSGGGSGGSGGHDAGLGDAGGDSGSTGSGSSGGGTGGGSGGGSTDAGFDAPVGVWTWIPIPGSECGSGSEAGFGINLSQTQDELLLFLQGGGACWNTGTCVPSAQQYGPVCYYGANVCLYDGQGGTQPLAVHVNERDPYPVDGGGAFPGDLAVLEGSRLLHRDDPQNPFRNASQVYVPYCTGDLHSGRTTRDYPIKADAFSQPTTYTMHYSGALDMDLYLAALKQRLPGLKTIYLMGVSAGAFGATLNLERVQHAFPNATVILLADSGPFIQPTPHWPQWHDEWAMEMPDGCADCDAGLPQVIDHLISADPTRRIALLSNDSDQVISYFFFGGQGPDAVLNPPYGDFKTAMAALEARYDASPNAKYFVIHGTSHVLLQGYGVLQADGGYSAPTPSADGGSDLLQFINGWASGGVGWDSSR